MVNTREMNCHWPIRPGAANSLYMPYARFEVYGVILGILDVRPTTDPTQLT